MSVLSVPAKTWLLATAAILGTWLLFRIPALQTTASDSFFTEEVKPILNAHCISCHGGVRQNGQFSMMNRAEFFRPNESGQPAIDSLHWDESELLRRLTHSDPETRMPLHAPPLSPAEIRTLKKWVKRGAPWGTHWAYAPLQTASAPARPIRATFFWHGRFAHPQPIDAYIARSLADHGLQPNPTASPAALLRRVSLDLCGLPAPPALARAFLKNPDQQAYSQLVDSLLQLPSFGEKWASLWLDIARYADSKGYEKDNHRDIWRYRDWVIQALNRDMPYPQFLREQLAGDLLPQPTESQFLATAFHRNTPSNDEGGTDDEEFRTAAVIDRVNTTFEGILGTTFSCTQCHGHPYEDFTQKEYFQTLAVFNNTRDEDTAADYPLLRHYPPSDSLQLIRLRDWVARKTNPTRAATIYQFLKFLQPVHYTTHADHFVQSELYDTKYLSFRKNGSARIPAIPFDQATRLLIQYRSGSPGILRLHLDSLNAPVWAQLPVPSTNWQWQIDALSIPPVPGTHHLWFSYSNPSLPNDSETGLSLHWLYTDQDFPGNPNHPETAYFDSLYWHLLRQSVPGTPVLLENPSAMRRQTHVFVRGAWQVKGESVRAGIPTALAFGKGLTRPDRLGLANWISSEHNPLTYRVWANRVWEQLFGTGLVETLEDFGSLGTPPSHPALLDYLAHQLIYTHRGSLKSLVREIVLSETYRQSAKISPKAQQLDPRNRLLSHAPRVRLTAEQLRDQALAVSGLLHTTLYGPPVMPYQPAGVWASPYDGNTWTQSQGADQYRRAVYTFFKRSSPYPSMLLFDAAGRNVCTARRIRTNTPLQALVTLNDPAFMEAAAHLGQRMHQIKGSLRHKISWGYQQLFYTLPATTKLDALEQLATTARKRFDTHPTQIKALHPQMPGSEAAALAVVANALLNLDEALTKN